MLYACALKKRRKKNLLNALKPEFSDHISEKHVKTSDDYLNDLIPPSDEIFMVKQANCASLLLPHLSPLVTLISPTCLQLSPPPSLCI